ncbi:hypothetical protein HD806DRAFT_528566 [Xylariaceae sp. AK1471]|nr:hypothetical protein HD806DRAFT_528566 [Xylariaceae sp. AK1471]
MDEETTNGKRKINLGAQDYDHISKKQCSEEFQTFQHYNPPSLESFDVWPPISEGQALGDSKSEILSYTYPQSPPSFEYWLNLDLGQPIGDDAWPSLDLTQDAAIAGVDAITTTTTTHDAYQPNILHQPPLAFSDLQYFDKLNESATAAWLSVNQLTKDSEPRMIDFTTLQHTEVTPDALDTSASSIANPDYSYQYVDNLTTVQTSQIVEQGTGPCENHHIPRHTETSPTCTPSVHSRDDSSSDSQNQLNDTQYDTCFGVITATPTSSSNDSLLDKPAASEVKLIPCGDMFKMYYEDTRKYAGLLALPALRDLLATYQTKLKGYLSMVKQNTLVPGGRKGKANPHCAREYSLRILVYGLWHDKNAVGEFLSDSGLFLQHPTGAECDLNINYFNPHYLVRLGGEMPRIEELSLEEDDQSAESTSIMDDVAKNRLLRMFDHADGAEAVVDVRPSSRLQTPLMEHQIKALSMMLEKESNCLNNLKFPSLWLQVSDTTEGTQYRHVITGVSNRNPTPVRGGIIADEMGLGKTLSMLALICSSLDSLQFVTADGEHSRTTLIVTPKSTLYGWQTQINRHIIAGQVNTLIYHGSEKNQLASQFDNVNIVLTTYETLRSEHVLKGPLFSRPWLRLVLDEAHHIRNRESLVFEACCQVRAQHRWTVTGTPVQNSLDDYGALISFLGVYPFQEKKQFDRWIAGPFRRSETNAIEMLRRLVAATCLRRTKANCKLSAPLPSRCDETQHVTLFTEDQNIYDFFKQKIQSIAMGNSQNNGASKSKKSKCPNILPLITLLRLICADSRLLPPSAIDSWKRGEDVLSDDTTNLLLSPDSDMYREDPEALQAVSTKRSQPSLGPTKYKLEDTVQDINLHSGQSATDIVELIRKEDQLTEAHPATSAKIKALLVNLSLQQAKSKGPHPPKSVIFSSWTKMLDQVEQAIRANGFSYQRMDGQSTLKSRSEAMKIFSEDRKCTVMLASTGSAGEGVDFTAAQYVHLLEPHWNPMAEAQAVDRVHRIGQTCPVTVTRYIVPNSIESYIQWVQSDKLRIIDASLNTLENAVGIEEKRWQRLTEGGETGELFAAMTSEEFFRRQGSLATQ